MFVCCNKRSVEIFNSGPWHRWLNPIKHSLSSFIINLYIFFTTYCLRPLSIYISSHLFLLPACLCTCCILDLHFLKHLLLSIQLSPSLFIYPSSPPQSVCLFLFPIHLSTYLPLFPICLFYHLSPPNSSKLAVCQGLCLASVNGFAAAVAVNTSQCVCSALWLSAAASLMHLYVSTDSLTSFPT